MPVRVVPILESPDYEEEIIRAGETLRMGGVVVVPTETVYGAAAVLTQAGAMTRLREIRHSSEPRPFTIHLARRADAARYIGEIGELAGRLMKKLWPGPVALTFEVEVDRRKQVAEALGVGEGDLYESSTIILRCPEHPVAADIIGQIEEPVVISASGARPALRADQIDEAVTSKADLLIDAGPTKYSKPSTILKVETDRYRIVRPGVYDERIIERLLRTTILFVCSGNTCRSAMAEGLARQHLATKLNVPADDLEKKGVAVVSAGAFAMAGSRATPAAVEAARKFGADISKHRSRQLTVELIHQADVIFTMGRQHAEVVTALVPSAAEKVFTLDPDRDIEDPIGGDAGLYQELAGFLQPLIEKRLQEKVVL